MELHDDGAAVLKARVCTLPEDGKANTALLAFMANASSKPSKAVMIVSGSCARKKVPRIADDLKRLAGSKKR